jgi:hypothetical protein
MGVFSNPKHVDSLPSFPEKEVIDKEVIGPSKPKEEATQGVDPTLVPPSWEEINRKFDDSKSFPEIFLEMGWDVSSRSGVEKSTQVDTPETVEKGVQLTELKNTGTQTDETLTLPRIKTRNLFRSRASDLFPEIVPAENQAPETEEPVGKTIIVRNHKGEPVIVRK